MGQRDATTRARFTRRGSKQADEDTQTSPSAMVTFIPALRVRGIRAAPPCQLASSHWRPRGSQLLLSGKGITKTVGRLSVSTSEISCRIILTRRVRDPLHACQGSLTTVSGIP